MPTSFGAVGTPTWFGFSELGLSEAERADLAWRTALFQGCAALAVPIVGLRLVLPWKQIRPHLVFVWLCVLACVLPYIGASLLSDEFPALIGGAVGLPVCVLLAKCRIGMSHAAVVARPDALEREHDGDSDGLGSGAAEGSATPQPCQMLALMLLM